MEYHGYGKIKIMRLVSSLYGNETIEQLELKKTIRAEIHSYGSNCSCKNFINLNGVSLQVYYLDDVKIYESINSDVPSTYLIKFIGVCE